MKNLLITGASQGIGKATAHQFSEEGATVIIAEFDKKTGEETAKAVNGHFVKTDISNEKSVSYLFEYIK